MGRGEQIISMHTRRDGIIAGQRRTSAALESIFTPLITISNVSSACVVTVVDADVVAELVAELVAVLEAVVVAVFVSVDDCVELAVVVTLDVCVTVAEVVAVVDCVDV